MTVAPRAIQPNTGIFSKRAKLARNDHADAGKIEERRVIAHIDVGLSLPEIFLAIKIIADEREHAEHPRPDPKERVADPADFSSKQKRQNQSRQEKEHGGSKHEEYPKGIEPKQDRTDDFQAVRVKTSAKDQKVSERCKTIGPGYVPFPCRCRPGMGRTHTQGVGTY